MNKVIDERKISEMVALREFAQKFPNVYIFGTGEIGTALFRYLKENNCSVQGFVASPEHAEGSTLSILDIDKQKSGIILGVDDLYFQEIMPFFAREGWPLQSLFILSHQVKQTILCRMRTISKEEFVMIASIVSHCNLNCRMCNKFAPIADEYYMPVEAFERDWRRLSDLCGGIMERLDLSGGEPFLHPELLRLIEVAYDCFPKAKIRITTNGLLLSKQSKDFWKICREKNVLINITPYPIALEYEKLKEKIEAQGVPVQFSSDFYGKEVLNKKTMAKIPLDLSGRQERLHTVFCNVWQYCPALIDGKIYSCGVIHASKIFQEKFGVSLNSSEQDHLDLWKISSFDEIADFLRRVPDFCKYCRIADREDGYAWAQSTRKMEEWV